MTSQYRILRPGRYKFQFKSDSMVSNVCDVDVKPGPLPYMEQIIEKLLPALPRGWMLRRSMRTPWGLMPDGPTRPLYITLAGKPGGIDNEYGMTLLIPLGGDPVDTDPWLKEEFDLWGISQWGPVYAHVHQVDELWPDHRAEIMRALGTTCSKSDCMLEDRK